MPNQNSTTALIFLALGGESEPRGATLREISGVADGINHAYPSPQELQLAMKNLRARGLVTKRGRHYFTTEAGLRILARARKKSDTAHGVWAALSEVLPDDHAPNKQP